MLWRLGSPKPGPRSSWSCSSPWPLLVLLFRREDAAEIYQRWRAWLMKNGQALVTVVLAVVALVLLVKGIVGLAT
jgi:hypothetical protein